MNAFHEELGHPSEATTRATAKLYGYTLTGQFEPCGKCMLAKAKQKKLRRINTGESAIRKGERLYVDISSPSSMSLGGRCHWALIVDECTGMAWSKFLKKKDDLKAVMIPFLKDLREKYMSPVKYIRCDGAGENCALDEACKQEGLGIQFEYTAPGTPQQNGKVERKFATLFGRVRAMLNSAGFPEDLRKSLWAEAANTATMLDTFLISSPQDKMAFQQFFGKGVEDVKKILKHAQKFGEMCVVNNNSKKLKNKLENRGVEMIWLGFAEDHSSGVFRLLNPKTRKVNVSRDVSFTGKTYGEWCKDKNYAKNIEVKNSKNEEYEIFEESIGVDEEPVGVDGSIIEPVGDDKLEYKENESVGEDKEETKELEFYTKF